MSARTFSGRGAPAGNGVTLRPGKPGSPMFPGSQSPKAVQSGNVPTPGKISRGPSRSNGQCRAAARGKPWP